ncbi:hypothetical protein HDF12_000595 [Edaphobacter lichenicola]|uniref:Uncharacterized protein n=1 Tax=Tunturiibacter lichenicola TaxID=2051959 RepID=A0A7Y9NIX6_9BACT|nr:hypothetical protein [Edaphobacter lichenicola]
MLGGSNNLPQDEDGFGLRGKQRGERSAKFEEPKSFSFFEQSATRISEEVTGPQQGLARQCSRNIQGQPASEGFT